ncbi:hypothetical protein KAW48_10730, partial [candidate division WOR-3 bacterium]|nr:hypothetical protein [candidate division WOR-3 bacterium]
PVWVFDFEIRENLVDKYFNPLKPDSGRVAYRLLPSEYADPDVSPSPINLKVEIRDKDDLLVYGPRGLTLEEQRRQVLYWGGRDNGGEVVDMEKYPYKADLILTYRTTGAKGRQLLSQVSKSAYLNPYSVSIVKPESQDTFWVDETPTMPTINCEGKVEGIFGDATYWPFIRWFWELKAIWHPINTSYRFSHSESELPQPLIGNPNYADDLNKFIGDSLWVKVKIEVLDVPIVKDDVEEHRGYIRGKNPARSTMNPYFGDNRLRAIGWHESNIAGEGWNQFEYRIGNIKKGLPLQGGADPQDIGIMQINMRWHTVKFPAAGWSWKANIDAGREYFNNCLRRAESWNNQNNPNGDVIFHNQDPVDPTRYDTQDHVLRDALCRYNMGGGTPLYEIVEEGGKKYGRPRKNPDGTYIRGWGYAANVLQYFYTSPHPWE